MASNHPFNNCDEQLRPAKGTRSCGSGFATGKLSAKRAVASAKNELGELVNLRRTLCIEVWPQEPMKMVCLPVEELAGGTFD